MAIGSDKDYGHAMEQSDWTISVGCNNVNDHYIPGFI